MTALVAFIRHGPTGWNGEKRLQGRSDQPLSEAGRAAVATWRLPPDIAEFEPHCSPLRRTVETARILMDREVEREPALIEMSYGDWEGRRLPDLRAELGSTMQENEDRGLDFTPPGGESPRMVLDRVAPLLIRWGLEGRNRIAITHKGVIRAVYAAAAQWNMTGRAPDKLRWDAAHIFRIEPDSAIRIHHLNLPLQPDPRTP
ncbi:MAG: histidine phosphatase family protein [Alphaproteobacteria bacterium]|nr:histidine phosphatase family protein [Alphaproteobacteria bacterium]